MMDFYLYNTLSRKTNNYNFNTNKHLKFILTRYSEYVSTLAQKAVFGYEKNLSKGALLWETSGDILNNSSPRPLGHGGSPSERY